MDLFFNLRQIHKFRQTVVLKHIIIILLLFIMLATTLVTLLF